jgi:integrase
MVTPEVGSQPYEGRELATYDGSALPALQGLSGLPDVSILAGQLAPSSIGKYRQDFTAYVIWCGSPEAALKPSSLARWRAHLANGTALSPATINRMISAVKRIMKEAASQGYLDAERALAFAGVAGVKPQALRSRQRPHARTRIEPADMRRLCSAPDLSTPVGKRDAALLATLASSGLRVSELVGLQVGSIYHRGGGYFVSVCGKNDVQAREAPLSKEAYRLIREWIASRPVLSPFIFTSFGGRGRDDDPGSRAQDKPLTTVAAWQIVQRYAKKCGLEHLKPHDFRRFVGTQLAARDIRKAQKALGHKRIDTTARHYVMDDLDPGLTDDLY